MDAREMRTDMEFQLESLRNSYRYFKKTKGIKDRIKHMATLRKMGVELSKQLADVPVYPTLFELRKENEDEMDRILCLQILALVDYHTTTEIMSKAMVQEVATRIAYQFGGLTLEDVALCFHQVKNGLMGKVYNRVDAAVIMSWLHKYLKDVQEIGQERNARLHNQSKTGIVKNGHEYRLVQPARIKDLV